MKQFLIRRWFLISLAVVLAFGVAGAPMLKGLLQAATLRSVLVALVLFVMALPLEARSMWGALQRPAAPLLATSINFGLLPLVALVASFALQADFGQGLLVAAATPCTLASAAVWTRRAGGNDSVAILVTILTM